MSDELPRDENPQPMPDAAGQGSQPEPPAFRDWQHRLGPRHLPGSPTSQGNFLYLGMELRKPRKAPPSGESPPPQ